VEVCLQAAYDSGFKGSTQYHELRTYLSDMNAMIQVEETPVEGKDVEEIAAAEAETEADDEGELEGEEPPNLRAIFV